MYWCTNFTKMQYFHVILRSKKNFIDSFHECLLSTYNMAGYWLRSEDLMVNKNRHSPCSHGACGWMDQKDANQEIPTNEHIITNWNKCSEGKGDGGANEGWKSDPRAEFRSLRIARYIPIHGNWMGTDSRTHWRNWNSKTRVVGGQRARRRENKMMQERKEEVEPRRAFVGQVKDFDSPEGF